MKTISSTLVVLLLALASTPACEGCPGAPGDDPNEGEGEDDDDDLVIADPNLHTLFLGVCRFNERCPSDAFAVAYRSLDECAEIFRFVFTCRIGDVDGGTFTVEERELSVTAAEAQACAAFLDTLSCEDFDEGLQEGTPCDVLGLAFSDDAGAGESCESEGCGPGLACVTSGDPDVCPVCIEELGAGEACNGGQPVGCREGLVCGFEGTCTGPKPDGASCFSAAECASELCSGDTCTSPKVNGAVCSFDAECQSLFCRDNGGQSQCAIPVDNGGACASDDVCKNRICDDANGVCGLPNASQCSFSAQCASGYCDPSAGCVTPRPLGGSCDNDEMCATGACELPRGVCVLSCEVDDDCAASDRCDEGRCVVPRPNGSSCDIAEECASGFCSFDDVCADSPSSGGGCSDSFDCPRSDRCVGGTCVPKAGPDEACDAFDACLDPFICIQGTCTLIGLECRPAPIGDRCTFLRVCDDSGYCDFGADITCQPRVGQGQACDFDDECALGLACSFGATGGTCVARGTPGADCSTIPCGDNLFCDVNASPPACRPQGQGGAPCNDDDECLSDQCFGDTCEPVEGSCALP